MPYLKKHYAPFRPRKQLSGIFDVRKYRYSAVYGHPAVIPHIPDFPALALTTHRADMGDLTACGRNNGWFSYIIG